MVLSRLRSWTITRFPTTDRKERIMRRLPKHRRPAHAGEVLLEDFFGPMGLTQKEAAQRLRISYPRMNELVNGKRRVTPETAVIFQGI